VLQGFCETLTSVSCRVFISLHEPCNRSHWLNGHEASTSKLPKLRAGHLHRNGCLRRGGCLHRDVCLHRGGHLHNGWMFTEGWALAQRMGVCSEQTLLVTWPQCPHNVVPRLNLEEKWPDLCKFKLFTSIARNWHMRCRNHVHSIVATHFTDHSIMIAYIVGVLYNRTTFV